LATCWRGLESGLIQEPVEESDVIHAAGEVIVDGSGAVTFGSNDPRQAGGLVEDGTELVLPENFAIAIQGDEGSRGIEAEAGKEEMLPAGFLCASLERKPAEVEVIAAI
jgi:hypothetical protein